VFVLGISSEKAFDMLPYAVDIFDKIGLKEYITKNQIDKDDEQALKSAGFAMISHVIKNVGKCKEEVFNILAIVGDQSVDDVKQQPVKDSIKQFKDLLNDMELLSFFKQAML